jgi:EAL and modified HD-GYP domain-containing signal transduction protein
MVPYKNIIVEVLESVLPTEENYQVLRSLFHRGYPLALDDFVYHSDWERFIPFVKLIKIDIVDTPLDTIGPLVRKLKGFKAKLLAEKVETYEQFRQAQEMGFDYFQGFFFCKPDILIGKDIASSQHFLLSIYGEVMKDGFDYKKVERFFAQDMGLTYKLLRFVNSSLFERSQQITSIKQAIVFLGENQLRKFICLIITAQLSTDKPAVLLQGTIVRARMCELIAKAIGHKVDTDAAFLTGLFSTIDAILDRSMENIMESLPLAQEIKDALIIQQGPLSECMATAKAYIEGDWEKIFAFVETYQVSPDHLISSCHDAMNWYQSYQSVTSK